MYNNSSNPFPSSINGFPPPSSSFYYHHHHHPFVTGDCSTTTTTTTTIAPPLVPIYTKVSEVVQCCDINNNNNNHNNNNNNHFSSSISPFPSKNKVAGSKKDRHSKIFTAQGPRDRRVRLSIDISRKFFGLQDLLGFDKASKTLDWLFTKSKTAIKDLVEEMKQQHTSSSTLTNQCEEAFMGKKGDHNNILEKKGSKRPNSKKPVSKCVTNGGGKRKANSSKKTTLVQKPKSGFCHVSLAARIQLRAEARARARERTIEKMQKVLRNDQSKINNHVIVVDGDHHQNYCYQVQNQEVKIGDQSAAMEQKLQNKPYSLLYTTTTSTTTH